MASSYRDMDYHVLKRTRKKRTVWILGVLADEKDKRGRRTYATMTVIPGAQNKSHAHKLAGKMISEGRVVVSKDDLEKFLVDFWTPGKSQYLKSQAARNRSMSTLYVNNSRATIQRYFLPYFHERGITKLSELTREKCEQWITWINEQREQKRKGYRITPTTINKCRQAVNVALGWAEKMEKIPRNPMQHVEKLPEKPRERTIFEINELAKLFDMEWPDYRCYTAALLAASSGMRLGEIRGVREDSINEDFTILDVKYNWQDTEGLKEPKWNSRRQVPLRSRVVEALQKLLSLNPYVVENRFLFWGESADVPMDKWPIQKAFLEALVSAEIPKAGRSFHSLRHSFTSHMRGKMGPENVMRVLGHKSLTMTDSYTHETDSDRQVVKQSVEGYF